MTGPRSPFPVFTAVRGMFKDELVVFTTIMLLEALEPDGAPAGGSIDLNVMLGLTGLTKERLLKAVAGLAVDYHLLPLPVINPDGSIWIRLNLAPYKVSVQDVRHVCINRS